MKSAILSTLLLAAACGCATPPHGDRDIAPIVKTAAYVGTHYALVKHPEWKQDFELAANELRGLENSETIDFVTILAIINRLPIKELKSDNAAIVVTSATILLSEYGGRIVPVEQVAKAKPIAAAIRQGIELALGN